MRVILRLLLVNLFIISFFYSCKKDCLKKGKCSPSSYVSQYIQEQSLPPATGTIYYIDSEKGKKKNNGKSDSDAFKTVKQLKDIEFLPGDQILFKRGQYHFGEFELKYSGTSSNRIYISSYGDGFMPIFKSEDGTNLKSTKKAIFLNKANYITIQNLNLQGGGQSIVLSNSSYVIVEGCRIGENSESGIRATGEYSSGDGSNFGEIHHCLIYSNASGNLGDRQGTDGIQLFDGASNWHIHNNELKAWTHSAISIKQLNNLKSNNNNIIENNLFDCSDVDYMRAIDITGGDNKCQNNLIQKNTIKNQTVTSHFHGNDNILAYNMFLNLQSSTATEQPWAIDFHIITNQIGMPDKDKLVCYNNKIYNNLIYNYANGTGIRLLNAKNGASYIVHDNEIINNIFYNVGKAIEMDDEPTNTTISNNIFFNPNSNIQLFYNGNNYTLNSFESLSSLYTNNLEANPLFNNTNDFKLNISSPAIDSGLNVGLTTDFYNNPINGLPDIGAVEH